jgi:hypothetical protein
VEKYATSQAIDSSAILYSSIIVASAQQAAPQNEETLC